MNKSKIRIDQSIRDGIRKAQEIARQRESGHVTPSETGIRERAKEMMRDLERRIPGISRYLPNPADPNVEIVSREPPILGNPDLQDALEDDLVNADLPDYEIDLDYVANPSPPHHGPDPEFEDFEAMNDPAITSEIETDQPIPRGAGAIMDALHKGRGDPRFRKGLEALGLDAETISKMAEPYGVDTSVAGRPEGRDLNAVSNEILIEVWAALELDHKTKGFDPPGAYDLATVLGKKRTALYKRLKAFPGELRGLRAAGRARAETVAPADVPRFIAQMLNLPERQKGDIKAVR